MAEVKLCGMHNFDSIDERRMAELNRLGIGGDEAVDIIAYERGRRHGEQLCHDAHQAVSLLARMLGVAKDAQVIALLDRLSRQEIPQETRFFPHGWLSTRRSADIRDRLPAYGLIRFYEVSILPHASHIARFAFEKDGVPQLSGMRVNLAEDVVLDDISGADNAQIKADAQRFVEVAIEALLA